MSNIFDEVVKMAYEEAYKKGRADAYKEMRKTITIIAEGFINAIDAEIKEIDKQQ